VGAKEVETATLSVRTRAGGELGAIALDEVQERLQRANAEQGAF
jgi:threonyl-tRNA synthetase